MSIIETKIVMAGIFLTLFAAGFINPIQGETGKGTDVFRVTMTIFGVEKSVGDLVAIVAVNNGQDSKVKLGFRRVLCNSRKLHWRRRHYRVCCNISKCYSNCR